MVFQLFSRSRLVPVMIAMLLAGIVGGCIKQRSASRSYGIEDRDTLDPAAQKKVEESCAPEDERGLLDPDTEAQLKSDCMALHHYALNMQAGRNGKVKVQIQRKKSDFEEFLPSSDMLRILGDMKKAVTAPDETDVLRFFGCRITPALGDPSTLLGQKGTGSNNPKDCAKFATDPNWGTTILGDTRQFEFVFVRGADSQLYQAIRVTGNWQELSAIFIYRKPLAKTVMVTHRPDSWGDQIAFPAPLPSNRFFEGKEGADEQDMAAQMLGLAETEKAPRDLEEFSQIWLKQQVDGARRVAVSVGASLVLSAASLPALGAAMGALWTSTAGTVGYFTAGAASGAAAAAGITSAGTAAASMATSAFGVALAAGGLFTAVSVPLHRWIDDLPPTPFKISMQTAYFVMVAADVYKTGRGFVVHTARAFGTSKKLIGHVLNPESWKSLMNISSNTMSKREIIARLNSRGGATWERFKLAMNGLRNGAPQMRGALPSAARSMPSEVQLELKDLLTPSAAGSAVASDVSARVKVSQLLEER
ncbi:MAG: hypothetical protein RIR26_1749, partial [Pseudomonadota bacterium]